MLNVRSFGIQHLTRLRDVSIGGRTAPSRLPAKEVSSRWGQVDLSQPETGVDERLRGDVLQRHRAATDHREPQLGVENL